MNNKVNNVVLIFFHIFLIIFNSSLYSLISFSINLFLFKYFFILLHKPFNDLTVTVYSIYNCMPAAFLFGIIVYLFHLGRYKNNFREILYSLVLWILYSTLIIIVIQGIFYPFEKSI